jgi:hypothetical protein
MRRAGLVGLGALALFACAPYVASASTVIYGATQTPDMECTNGCPDLTTSTGQAVFDLASAGNITGVQFWTYELAGAYNDGTLDWAVYLDVSNAQGALEGQGTFNMDTRPAGTDVSIAGIPLVEFQNNFTISPLNVSGSQNYFLDLWDPSGLDGPGIYWAKSSDTAMAFELFGTLDGTGAPEPGSFAMLAGGLLLGVVGMRVRRGRHK